jgi:hypothetical protein
MIWKKLVFLLFLIVLLQTGHAQISKGTLMTGGSLGFQYTTDHENHVNTLTFNVNPFFGGFVAKNFVLGVAPLIMYTKSSGNYNYIDSSFTPPKTINVSITNSQTSLGLGPYARYYFKIAPKVYVFIHGSPSIMATWYTYSSDPKSPVARTISANWVIGPGLSVMLTRSVAIELSWYYQGAYHRSAQFMNGNLLGEPGKPYVDNGMVFNVGFQVYLERKKKEAQPEMAK